MKLQNSASREKDQTVSEAGISRSGPGPDWKRDGQVGSVVGSSKVGVWVEASQRKSELLDAYNMYQIIGWFGAMTWQCFVSITFRSTQESHTTFPSSDTSDMFLGLAFLI